MSVDVLPNFNQNPIQLETVDAGDLTLLEKCGEVFLERQLGNIIYVCNFCEERFQSGVEFSNHLTDVHVSIENFITYESSSESDAITDNYENTNPAEECTQEKYQPLETFIQDGLVTVKTEFDSLDVYSIESLDENEISAEDQQNIEPEIESIDVRELEDVPSPSEISINEKTFAQPKSAPRSETIIIRQVQRDPSDEEILRSKLVCKFCGDQFDYVKDMQQHDCGVNKKKKTYHCSVCGKLFKKKSGLDIHSLLHKGEKPHKCDICGTSYACKQNLIVHVRRHTGEKPFKCDYCEKAFASSTERISHTRTHTGERPFVCELCGKGHSSASQLTEHMRRHLDIRNHACKICNKRFRSSYNLRMHLVTHDKGPRQYNCDECKATFKTHNNLMQHTQIHSKIKKHVCKICGRAFAQHPGLYSHMKSHTLSNK